MWRTVTTSLPSAEDIVTDDLDAMMTRPKATLPSYILIVNDWRQYYCEAWPDDPAGMAYCGIFLFVIIYW